ncbi:MAG: GAF domain-containing protein [Salinivirgaceae bacterium]
MNNLIIFSLISVFGFLPLAIISVRIFYKKTIVFPIAVIILSSATFCSLLSFVIGERGFTMLYWIAPVCIVGLLILNFYIKKIIQKPLQELKKSIDLSAQGILNFELHSNILRKEDEIGATAQSFHKLIIALNKTAEFSDEIAKNNFTVDYELLSNKDAIGKSLLNMRESLLKAQEQEKIRMVKEEEENWVNQGIAKFSDILRSNSDNQEQLAVNFIRELVDYLGIVQGGLFIINEEDENEIYFELKAAVAYNRQKLLNKKFRIGESLVGRCAYEKLPIYMMEVPSDYVKITSGLGEANPRSISLIPAVMENKVYAVIELVSFEEFKPYQLSFISRIGENLASTISMVRVHEQTSKLLEESKLQQEELAAQEEEMRQNMEELIATQEQMERRESQLKQILSELENQEGEMKRRIEKIKTL